MSTWVGPDICEALVRQRFPGIGQANARVVAAFVDGNARIALALVFPIYLSGTEAGPEQRARIVRRFLNSLDLEEVELGLGMLPAAFKTDHFILGRDVAFGARARSSGWLPASRGDEVISGCERSRLRKVRQLDLSN